jgi:hypothetical protein
MAPRLLVDAVRKVHAGGRWVETQLVGRALERMLRRDAALKQLSDDVIIDEACRSPIKDRSFLLRRSQKNTLHLLRMWAT